MTNNSLFELAGRFWLLTLDHPASHYGKPVLIETDRFGRAHIGDPIGLDDQVVLPAELPPRSLGLELEAVKEGVPTRAYSGREIAGFAAHPSTIAGYLSQGV